MRRYSTLERITLVKTDCERDLGIMISNDLKPTAQVNKPAAKAHIMISILKNTVVNRGASIWIKLYTTYFRPHIEFAIAAWSPYMAKDISCLEKVQRRVTKLVHATKNLPYEGRCKTLKLTKLSMRRIRGDLIQQFKFFKEIDHISWYSKPNIRTFV